MTAAWHVATLASARPETGTARRLVLDVPGWPGNDAGQHLDVRLTAPGGYQATRSYSIASSGPTTHVELAVDRLPDGEVSPYLVGDIEPGDQLEVHGPLGGYFVWRPDREPDRPVQLIAGGSGVVPLVAMVRSHAAAGVASPFRLLYSVRTPDDVFFGPELTAAVSSCFAVDFVYTRSSPAGAAEPAGRLTRDRLAALSIPAELDPRVFVCGPTGFVEQVAQWLQELGHQPGSIRTERFGGS